MQYEVRRQDRQIDQATALRILDQAEYGVLSLVGEDGFPYGIPVNFVREGDLLLFHCALEGRKMDNLRFQTQVSFCTVGRTHILPGAFSTEYESAIVEGNASIIADEDRKSECLVLLCRKYYPDQLEAAEQYIAAKLHRTAIIEIQIESITGKAHVIDC